MVKSEHIDEATAIARRNGRLTKPKIKRLYLIPILSKALDVLELLEQTNGPIALEDVYQQTNISKTSVYRILKTLVHRGYVAQGQSGQYRLVSRPAPPALRIRGAERGDAVSAWPWPPASPPRPPRPEWNCSSSTTAMIPMWPSRTRKNLCASASTWSSNSRWKSMWLLTSRISSKRPTFPLVAIDVPHPNATYFGVDNFEVGYEAGVLLAQYAINKWKSKADWVLGIGFSEAGSFVQSRIAGAFEGIRERLDQIPVRKFPAPRRARHAPAQLRRRFRVSPQPSQGATDPGRRFH